MAGELNMRWDAFETALARRAATSSRDFLALGVEQMRGLIREVVKITPPGHEGLPGGTREAMMHGRSFVAADINTLYGTAGDAYDQIKKTDPKRADAFWFMHQQGKEDDAALVMKSATGDWYGPFDDGKIHRTHYKRGRLSQRRGRHIIYVSDAKALADYVKEKQDHVMYLTAGWKEAFGKLGISLPQFVGRHSAPGNMVIEVSDRRIRLVATNAVPYGPATDLQRRIQFAIDAQTGKMQRQWDEYMKKLNAKAGL